MGFESPARDYIEDRLSLDSLCNTNRPGVYLFRSGSASVREGIKNGALLVVDFGATAVDGSIVVCVMNGEFGLRRLRKHPRPSLELLDRPQEAIQLTPEDETEIRGVVTHVLNDTRKQ